MLRSVIEYIVEPWVKALRYIFIGRSLNHWMENLFVSYAFFLAGLCALEPMSVFLMPISVIPAAGYTLLAILIENAISGISKKQDIRIKMEAQRGDITAI